MRGSANVQALVLPLIRPSCTFSSRAGRRAHSLGRHGRACPAIYDKGRAPLDTPRNKRHWLSQQELHEMANYVFSAGLLYCSVSSWKQGC